MLFKKAIIVGVVAAVTVAQNIAWKGSAPICNPKSFEQEDFGARPYELRRSKSGDGNACITGHKKCCADEDNELNRVACQFSDNGRHNPNSDPDDDDYWRTFRGLRLNKGERERGWSF
ncbi:hypothetical protein BGW39_009886 [Mortierella sp. 14UC]|nr:hypothetical protein BGW39_009886 [Mortierella sp. 14UC]